MCFLTKFYLAVKIGFSMVPLLVFSTIVMILIPANSLVSAVLHPPGSHPTTICDLPHCSCDQKVYCRCTDAMQTIVLRSHGFDHLPEMTGSIIIERCNKVLITKGAILRMKALRKINLENIAHLEMDEEAFTWDTTRIQEVYTYPERSLYSSLSEGGSCSDKAPGANDHAPSKKTTELSFPYREDPKQVYVWS